MRNNKLQLLTVDETNITAFNLFVKLICFIQQSGLMLYSGMLWQFMPFRVLFFGF